MCPQSPAEELRRWMVRYQQADPAAPGALIQALSPPLMGMFRSQSASQHEAEDLLQETWLRVHRARHTYRSEEPLLPWIFAIARRVRIDQYRKTRRFVTHEVPFENLPEPATGSRNQDGVPRFETLVATLPEAEREVLTLMKVSGMTVEEVARATSGTVGSVKQKAHRAYQRLRKLLEGVPAQAGLQDGRA